MRFKERPVDKRVNEEDHPHIISYNSQETLNLALASVPISLHKAFFRFEAAENGRDHGLIKYIPQADRRIFFPPKEQFGRSSTSIRELIRKKPEEIITEGKFHEIIFDMPNPDANAMFGLFRQMYLGELFKDGYKLISGEVVFSEDSPNESARMIIKGEIGHAMDNCGTLSLSIGREYNECKGRKLNAWYASLIDKTVKYPESLFKRSRIPGETVSS